MMATPPTPGASTSRSKRKQRIPMIWTIIFFSSGAGSQAARKGRGEPGGVLRTKRTVGGCTRTRTLGPLIKSQLLYQLSYAPIPAAAEAVR